MDYVRANERRSGFFNDWAGKSMLTTGLCPICGVHIAIEGETTDGRVYGSCGDAFTMAQWNAPDE